MNSFGRALGAVFIAMWPTIMQSQVRAKPGTVIEGKIATTIYVTMLGDGTRGKPVAGVPLLVISELTDSVLVETDGAGAKTIMLAPGLYRLTTLRPVEWQGSSYQWDLRLDVAPGVGITELTQRNAVSSAVTLSPRPTPPVTPLLKDEFTAQMFSFLLPGTGQMYAGESRRGAALLIVGLFGDYMLLEGWSTMISCNVDPDCVSSNGKDVALVGLAIGGIAWLYSIADADDAVRRWNRAHRETAHIRVTPFGNHQQLGLRLTAGPR